MKIALVSLNSKYIHTNLAIRYLAESVGSIHHTNLFDFTIHDSPIRMAEEIFDFKPDVVGMSVYLWNRHETLKLAKIIRRILPDVFIVLGGPEVMDQPGTLLTSIVEIDGIISGEGETPFVQLVNQLSGSRDLRSVPNLIWREGSTVHQNGLQASKACLDSLPFPYEKEKVWNSNKIYYYESSRGCPFSCSFCMSSLTKTVRSLSWERIQSDLDQLLSANIRLVKFVDRTFNYDRKRALEIWRYLVYHYQEGLAFHFEIAADLLDCETLEFLQNVPPGYFQFEIGIQSTNPKTLEAVHRQTDLDKIFRAVEVLEGKGNIHIHLDLIAGLPYEDLSSLQESFDRVYAAKPDMLQLGFLKLLPGTDISTSATNWDYKCMPDPPYQVLSNRWLSFAELSLLMGVEAVLDVFGNSGRFKHALSCLATETASAFALYAELARFWKKVGLDRRGSGMKEHFSVLAEFVSQHYSHIYERFIEALKFDFCLIGKPGQLPEWFNEKKRVDGKVRQQLLAKLIPDQLPHLADTGTGTVRRQTEFMFFNYDCVQDVEEMALYMFDYTQTERGQPPGWIRIEDNLLDSVCMDRGEN